VLFGLEAIFLFQSVGIKVIFRLATANLISSVGAAREPTFFYPLYCCLLPEIAQIGFQSSDLFSLRLIVPLEVPVMAAAFAATVTF
jgi:hypothetical protein